MGAPHLRVIDESYIPYKPTQADALIEELAELNQTINRKRQANMKPVAFDVLMNDISGITKGLPPSRAPRPMQPKACPVKKVFVIPNKIETLRNRHGNGILTDYIKKTMGCTRVKLNEIFYNRNYRLSVEAHLS